MHEPGVAGRAVAPHGRLGRLAGIGLVAGVLLALIGLLAYGMVTPRKAAGSVPLIQRTASDFTLTTPEGGTVHLAALRGQPVVLNFWASWCIPCQQEAPVLEQGSRTYASQGVVFVGVDVWDTPSEAQAFLNRYGISYVTAVDDQGRTAIDYGVSGIPETFFVDRTGNVTRHFIGALNQAQLSAFTDELLR